MLSIERTELYLRTKYSWLYCSTETAERSSKIWGLSATRTGCGYAKFYSRSADAVIRVYDAAGNVTETHEHKGEFKDW